MGKRNKEDYISLHEAASVYGYTRDHLGYLIRKGDLKGQKLNSSSFGKSLSPYVTTHKWVKEYLIKSGKARKKDNHIKQSISSSVVPSAPSVVRRALKKELLPLWRDLKKIFNSFKKNFDHALNSVIFLLKDFKKEVKAWQVETKYLIKKTKKKTARSKIINSAIEFVRKGIDLVVLAFPVCRQAGLPTAGRRQKFQSFNLRKAIERSFSHQVTALKTNRYQVTALKTKAKKALIQELSLVKRIQREILWRISVRYAKSRKTNFSFKNLFSKFNPKLIGSLILLFGLTLSSLGIYTFSPNMLELFNTIQIKLANTLDRVSQPVYVAIESSDRLSQISVVAKTLTKNVSNSFEGKTLRYLVTAFGLPGNRSGSNREINLFRKTFPLKADHPSVDGDKEERSDGNYRVLRRATELSRIKNVFIKKAKIREKTVLSLINQIAHYKHFLVALSESVIQKIPQSLRYSHFSATLNPSNFLRTSFRKNLSQKMRFFASRVRDDLYAWQSSNNHKIARMDDKLVQMKRQALAQTNRGAREQLAQLNISFSFIKKPFAKLRNFIASRWGTEDRITELEQKIAKIEQPIATIRQNQEGARPELAEGARPELAEGLIVIPSTEYDKENTKKIKEAFSDEVTIESDETGKSGIIHPIFRKSTNQKYLYLLVPIKN